MVFSALATDKVNRCDTIRFDAAGKALSVSRVLSQLGKKSVHLTPLGGRLRPVFLDLCAADGIEVQWVESSSEIRFCYTLVDKERRQVTELVEEGDPAGEGAADRLLEAFDSLLPAALLLVISGSRTAGLPDSLVPEMVRRAKEAGIYVILDIRGADLVNSLPFRPDLVKPNLEEFAATFAEGNISREKIAVHCRELWERYGCQIVLTRGSRNLWYAETGTLEEFPVETAEALNTTGSGDAFTAGLASALADGAFLKEALAEASRCGRLNALHLKPGTILEK